MKVLVAVIGSWQGQDRDHENIFLCQSYWDTDSDSQWLDIGHSERQTASSHQSSEWSNLQKGSSARITCCWICWSLQITFLCGLCWFYVVRPGNTLLSYLAFSLLCSPCCLLFQNKYADRLPLEASALCSSPRACKYLHHTSLWAPRREQQHKEVQQRAGVEGRRVWN